MDVIKNLIERAQQNKQRIVLPEGTEERTLKAADKAVADGIAEIILLGNKEEILALAQQHGLANIEKATIIDPCNNPDAEKYANLLFELRKAKGMTMEDAQKLVCNPLYLGCLIIKNGDADGQVAGALNTTGNVLRPALQIIKTTPGISCVSGAMMLITNAKEYGEDGVLFVADVAVTPQPDANQLSQIAVCTAQTAKAIAGFEEPRVAMLSFSTKARNVVNEPFGVVNADDFYGADAFLKAAEFLTATPAADGKEHYGMIGYPLKNTLSDHGDVNRGICGIQNGYLDSVEEYTKIKTEEDGVCRGDSLSGERKPVDPEELVSMNFWVFPASFIGQIQDHFNRFLAAHGSELKSECYIPTVVDELIHNGKADCSVIKTTANWLGVTYPSDKPAVVESIAKLVEEGVYPAKLG